MSHSKTSNRFLLSSAIALALVFPLSLGKALADDTSFRFKTPATCTTEAGSVVNVTPGRYMPESEWLELDVSYKALEDRATRAEAEAMSLKESDSPGWKLPALFFMAGIAIGGYALGR